MEQLWKKKNTNTRAYWNIFLHTIRFQMVRKHQYIFPLLSYVEISRWDLFRQIMKGWILSNIKTEQFLPHPMIFWQLPHNLSQKLLHSAQNWLLSSSSTSSCLSRCTTQNQLLQLRRGKLQGNPKPQQEATFLWFNMLSLFLWDGTNQHTKHSFNSMKIRLSCLHYRSWDRLSFGWLSLWPRSNSMEYYFSAPCTFS